MKGKEAVCGYLTGGFCLLSFAGMAYLSERYFKGLYLFDWTRNQNYWHIWVLLFFFTGAKKPIMSISLALGNIAGVFLGHFLGGIDYAIRQGQIDPNLSYGEQYQLYLRNDWLIWIAIVLTFLIVGGLIQHGTIKPKCPKWLKRGLIRLKEGWLKFYNS